MCRARYKGRGRELHALPGVPPYRNPHVISYAEALQTQSSWVFRGFKTAALGMEFSENVLRPTIRKVGKIRDLPWGRKWREGGGRRDCVLRPAPGLRYITL